VDVSAQQYRDPSDLETLDAWLAEEAAYPGTQVSEHTAVITPPAIRYADQAHAITQPYIVHSRADIASMLRAHRIASGLTCEQFDGRAGWSDRYVTKAEHEYRARITIDPPSTDKPDGDIALSFMAEVWLETAGIALVLMPAELAASLGAVPAPRKERA
jgi:hypothetical protein